MAQEEIRDYVLDQLSTAGGFASRRMFGCWALFEGEAMFGLIDGEGRLYWKADERTRGELEGLGAEALRYETRRGGQRRTAELSFLSATCPLEDTEELARQARLARGAAQRALAARLARREGGGRRMTKKGLGRPTKSPAKAAGDGSPRRGA